jgi:hypothetical protein
MVFPKAPITGRKLPTGPSLYVLISGIRVSAAIRLRGGNTVGSVGFSRCSLGLVPALDEFLHLVARPIGGARRDGCGLGGLPIGAISRGILLEDRAQVLAVDDRVHFLVGEVAHTAVKVARVALIKPELAARSDLHFGVNVRNALVKFLLRQRAGPVISLTTDIAVGRSRRDFGSVLLVVAQRMALGDGIRDDLGRGRSHQSKLCVTNRFSLNSLPLG